MLVFIVLVNKKTIYYIAHMLKKKKLENSLIRGGISLLPYDATAVLQCLVIGNLFFVPFLHFHGVIAVNHAKLKLRYLLVT